MSVTMELPDAFWFQEGPGVRNWQFTTTGIKLLNVGNITKNGEIDLSKTDRCLSEEEVRSKYTHFLLDAGDLVIASSGISFEEDGLLRTRGAFVEKRHLPLCMNTSTIRFKHRAGLSDLNYLKFWLDSGEFRDQITRLVTGSAQQNFGPSHLKSIRITLPPLERQICIARELDKADRIRKAGRYALELTDTFLPAAFLELFGDQNLIVNQWPAVRLGEHLEAIEGGVNFNPVGENEPASDWRVLKVSAVSWSDFLAEESKPISPTETFNDELIVRRGDLIMSRANTVELVGAVARVRTQPPKVLLPDKLWRLKFHKESQLLPDYLLYALRSRALRREIEIRASGTSGSMKNISKEDVRELRLPLPPLHLQQKFTSMVGQVERLRAVQREALRQAEHFFQTFLHRAFSDTDSTHKESLIWMAQKAT